jgi:hypothetical protein
VPPLSDFYPEVLSLPQGIKGHLVVPNLSKVVYMIYDAGAQALPCEGRGVQHALFTEERVARDPAFFEPHIPPGPYCLVFFVRGFRRSLHEASDGLGVRSTVGSIEADGFECVAREQLAKDPGERARACEHLEQHEALSDRDDHTAGSLWKVSGELLEGVEPLGSVGPRGLHRVGGRGCCVEAGLTMYLPP